MYVFGIEIPLIELLFIFNALLVIYMVIVVYEIIKLRQEINILKSLIEEILTKTPRPSPKSKAASKAA